MVMVGVLKSTPMAVRGLIHHNNNKTHSGIKAMHMPRRDGSRIESQSHLGKKWSINMAQLE